MPRDATRELVSTRDKGGELQARPSDREIGQLARRQYGVVSRAQLIKLGLGEDAIDARLSGGRLYRLHRGAYAVGHRVVPREGRWLAAVLSIGGEAVLSHRSAAELWGVRRVAEDTGIDISAPRLTRSPPGIRRHYLRLAPDEVTTRGRIPVTTLARSLFDVAATVSDEGLEAAIRQAEYLHRFQVEKLDALLVRHPGGRGARSIKACLYRLGRGPRGRTRSKLEVRFAGLLARAELPKPELNALLDVDGFKVEADCLWREQHVIVELDGGRSHRTRAAFESDRERDRRLQAAGWRVIRVTWRQLDEPAALLVDLSHILQSRLHSPSA
jgi:very-short-patch-repair endonuclease